MQGIVYYAAINKEKKRKEEKSVSFGIEEMEGQVKEWYCGMGRVGWAVPLFNYDVCYQVKLNESIYKMKKLKFGPVTKFAQY